MQHASLSASIVKHHLIRAGFAAFAATRLHRLAAPLTRGLGAILTFHRVQPLEARDFSPNGSLEITPAFLHALLGHVRELGYEIIPLSAVLPRLHRQSQKPFVALTFDDGYRDTLEHALPILERHAAPFTVYVTTGFADRTARLWWVELETAIRHSTTLTWIDDEKETRIDVRTVSDKRAAFERLMPALRRMPNDRRLAVIAELAKATTMKGPILTDHLCMSWPEIQRLAAHPLITLGGHTQSHANLAQLDPETLRTELDGSRALLEERLDRPITHFAYPYGGSQAAGAREFEAARTAGFKTAVTTRPGVLFPRHAKRALALPRLSVNGLHQSRSAIEVLLSGAATMLWLGRD